MKILIGVAGEGEWLHAGDAGVYAKLLAKFARQRLLRPLARVDLAAGKLPQAGKLLSRRALGEQHAAIGVDQRGRDDEEEF